MSSAPSDFAFAPAEVSRLRDEIAAAGFATAGPPALAPALAEALLAEARAKRVSGWGKPTGEAVDHEAWRADLGPVAREFLASRQTRQLLEETVGATVQPSWAASCFTYYDGPGGYLGRHRDRPDSCAYTLILYLQADWPDGAVPSEGMALRVFPETASQPVRCLQTRTNALILGRGAQVWHERAPLGSGEKVIALTACFSPGAVETISRERSRDLAALLVDEGVGHWSQGDHATALERFDRALEKDAMSDTAWAGRGFVFWSQQRFEQALGAFMEAMRRNGAVASHWSNAGLCLRDLGQPERAIAAFAAALALDPGYAPAINEWGNVLQDQGRAAEAIDFYSRALALDPARAVVHHNLGIAYARMGEPMLALEAFLAALERDAGYPHSLEEIAILLARSGQKDAAREFLERARTPRAKALFADLGLDA